MYYNIYEVNTSPIQNSMMDAVSIGDHSVFISKCAVVDELEDKERTITLQDFGKWLKKRRAWHTEENRIYAQCRCKLREAFCRSLRRISSAC